MKFNSELGKNLVELCSRRVIRRLSFEVSWELFFSVLKVGGSVYDPGESRRGSMNSDRGQLTSSKFAD